MTVRRFATRSSRASRSCASMHLLQESPPQHRKSPLHLSTTRQCPASSADPSAPPRVPRDRCREGSAGGGDRDLEVEVCFDDGGLPRSAVMDQCQQSEVGVLQPSAAASPRTLSCSRDELCPDPTPTYFSHQHTTRDTHRTLSTPTLSQVFLN